MGRDQWAYHSVWDRWEGGNGGEGRPWKAKYPDVAWLRYGDKHGTSAALFKNGIFFLALAVLALPKGKSHTHELPTQNSTRKAKAKRPQGSSASILCCLPAPPTYVWAIMIDERGNGIRSDTALCVRRVDSDWRSAWDWRLEAPGPPCPTLRCSAGKHPQQGKALNKVQYICKIDVPVRTSKNTHVPHITFSLRSSK